jgi:hypothetical protein
MNIICYYTPEYRKDAKLLKETMDIVGLDTSHVEERDSLGSWEKNCQAKANFILEKLEELKEPVVWVDADARIMQKPRLFEDLGDTDFAAHWGRWLMSGTLYFGNTIGAKALLKTWIEIQEDPEEMRWDQKILEEIIDTIGSKLKIVKLPVTYCQKFDDRTLSLEDAVILHTQASRRLKKEINGE